MNLDSGLDYTHKPELFFFIKFGIISGSEKYFKFFDQFLCLKDLLDHWWCIHKMLFEKKSHTFK